MDLRAVMALVSMVVVLGVVTVWLRDRVPISLALFLSCIVGSAVAGFGFPVRHLVEGQFGYFYVALVILTGVVFLKVIEANGSLGGIMKGLGRRFGRFPPLLLFLTMALLYLPGMVTGLGIPAVLTAGALIAPLLLKLEMPKTSVAALIAMGACLGSVTGPVNLPLMIITGAVNMPYQGFGRVLPAITIPMGILAACVLGLGYARRADPGVITREFQPSPGDLRGPGVYLPVLTVGALMVAFRALPLRVPDLSTPLAFTIGTIVALASGRKIPVGRVMLDAVDSPVLDTVALMLSVGVVVQISTLTGIRGIVTIASLSMPKGLIFLGLAVALPLLGGVLTMLGTAAILGMPFVVALLGRNVTVLTGAVSVICAMGVFAPPTAIVGLLASRLVGVDYAQVLRKLAVPGVATIVLCILMILFANQLAAVLA